MTAATPPTARAATRLLEPRVKHRVDALQVALGAVLLTHVWRVQDLIPGFPPLKLPTLAIIAAVVLLFLDPRVARRWTAVRRQPAARVMPWFAVAGVISIIFGIAPAVSAESLLKTFLPAIALVMIVPLSTFSARDGLWFAVIQVLGATLYSIAALTRFDVDSSGRLNSLIYYDANDIGMLLVCTVPLCFYLFRHARTSLSRAVLLSTAGLFLVTIQRTGSRGAFVGLVAVALYLICNLRSTRSSTRGFLVAGFAALMLLGAGVKYRASIASILHPTKDYNWYGDVGRISLWKRGLSYTASKPLTGIGVDAFPVAEGTLSPLAEREEYGRGVKWSAAHSIYIQVLAELGIPGFVAFLSMIWLAWRAARRLARDAARLGDHDTAGLADSHAASLVGFVVCGVFLSQAYSPYLYLVIGMIVGLDITTRAGWWTAPAPSSWKRSAAARRRARAASFRPEVAALPPAGSRQ